MDAPKSDLEPWQWPEEHWRKLVARVRAGRSLRPAAWPGGARCAVALSFDSDHETSDLRDGGKSIGRLAWGQFGNRVGVPRILRLLERYDVENEEAMAFFESRLRRIGVIRALEAEGFEPGNEIEISGVSFELDPVADEPSSRK